MTEDKKIELLKQTFPEEPAQAAALCMRRKAGRIEVLLVTSRDTGRWVLPKGWAMKNKSLSETAQIEAWEEAGVVGDVKDEAIGSYVYDKVFAPGKAHPCRVEVYPVKVRKLETKFPERSERRRKWMGAKKAAKSVMEPDLSQLLRQLHKIA